MTLSIQTKQLCIESPVCGQITVNDVALRRLVGRPA